MHIDHLENMVKGWFVGAFEPTVLRTQDVEVGVKAYQAGDAEGWHYHKIATEITVVVSGEVEMMAQRFGPGTIIKLAPGEGTAFRALTDATTVVVKYPGALNDKYTEAAIDA